MIARVVVRPCIWSRFNANAIREKSFGKGAGCVALFTDLAAAPGELSQRSLNTIGQQPDTRKTAQTIIGKLSALISSVDCNQPVCRIPFIGPGSSGGSGDADLVKGVV